MHAPCQALARLPHRVDLRTLVKNNVPCLCWAHGTRHDVALAATIAPTDCALSSQPHSPKAVDDAVLARTARDVDATSVFYRWRIAGMLRSSAISASSEYSQRRDCLAGHVGLEVRRETGKE
jgi:hypothetical protein